VADVPSGFSLTEPQEEEEQEQEQEIRSSKAATLQPM
jgi:hypothetical protein